MATPARKNLAQVLFEAQHAKKVERIEVGWANAQRIIDAVVNLERAVSSGGGEWYHHDHPEHGCVFRIILAEVLPHLVVIPGAQTKALLKCSDLKIPSALLRAALCDAAHLAGLYLQLDLPSRCLYLAASPFTRCGARVVIAGLAQVKCRSAPTSHAASLGREIVDRHFTVVPTRRRTEQTEDDGGAPKAAPPADCKPVPAPPSAPGEQAELNPRGDEAGCVAIFIKGEEGGAAYP